MSRYHPHPQTQYGNNYKASDDPRDHQNKVVRSDPSRNRARDFSGNYPFEMVSRHENDHREPLPSLNLKGSMPEDYWHTPAQMAATSADDTRQPRRPAEGFGPFDRTCKKPVRDQKMNFPLADLLSKRASLHGEHPTSTVTLLNTQDTNLGEVMKGDKRAPRQMR